MTTHIEGVAARNSLPLQLSHFNKTLARNPVFDTSVISYKVLIAPSTQNINTMFILEITTALISPHPTMVPK